MFKRQEASRLKEAFWTTFGQYMSPIPSAEGLKINWINYHTQVKDVFFRMDAGQKSATIGIMLEHKDLIIQQLYFEKLLELKLMLESEMNEAWVWELHHTKVDGKTVSRVYTQLENVSIYNKDHWPTLISFFKPRMISLDAFWENAKHTFDDW